MSDSRPGQQADETDIAPASDGTRTDNAGSSATLTGPAPGGNGATQPPGATETTSEPNIPTGQGTGAGGGFGVGSDRGSSGGSGDGETNAGDDGQTEWLREASGLPDR